MTPISAASVDEQGDVTIVPGQFELLQNYPNSFNPTTTIRYALPNASQVILKIYNLIGEVVKTLVNGYQSEQYHQMVWNRENEIGQKSATGIYLYHLLAGVYKQTKRLIIMK